MSTLARGIARYPWAAVTVWLVATVISFLFALGITGPGLFNSLETGEPTVPGEAVDGRQRLADASATGPGVQLMVSGVDPADPVLAGLIARTREQLADDDRVQEFADPTMFGDLRDPRAQALLAVDGDGLLVTAAVPNGLSPDVEDAAVAHLTARLEGLGRQIARTYPTAHVQISSVQKVVTEITDQVEDDLRTGESVALPISLFIMVLVFGGFTAAGIPIGGAIASIAGGLMSMFGFALLIDLDATVVNVVSVLGLGLCIDYGLLMVNRFREELRAHVAPAVTLSPTQRRDALAATMATAGRTVLFSGITVAIALSGLLLMPATILRSVAAGGVSVVVVAVLVALTLVPALLALTADRLNRPGALTRVPGLRAVTARWGDLPPERGVFSRLATLVQRSPLVVLGVVSAILIVLSLPAWQLSVRSSFSDMLPVGNQQRTFLETLDEQYPATRSAPIQVVLDGDSPSRVQEATRWSDRTASLPGVGAVDAPRTLDGVVMVGVHPADDDPGAATAVVHQVREHRPPGTHWVAGQAAVLTDFTDATIAAAPLVAGTVALATFVLLFLMTGSVLIPLKALAMNVVSLGATLGVIVWGFQDGHLEGLLNFTSPGGIETVIPAMVLALGFGLAMDYEVFLLARIKEFYDAGLPNDEAVVRGLQMSGRIITSAALIVIVVFLGFATGKLLAIKETGVALAVAVALDATLVRMLLVPATMTLLGDWNWWAPAPLRAFHARFGVRH